MHALHRCSILLQMSHVAWSVCLCVSHTGVLCKNGWTDRDAVWATDSGGPKQPCIRWRPRSAMGRGEFGAVRPMKSIGCLCCSVAAKWIIQSSITAWQRNCCRRLQCSWVVGVTLHCSNEKSAPAPCNEAVNKINLFNSIKGR